VVLYPNPILKEATLKYYLHEDQFMTIRLYDLAGQFIQTFMNSSKKGRGEHQEKLIFNTTLLPGNYRLVLETKKSKTPISIILK
jgi:hypothetical protein